MMEKITYTYIIGIDCGVNTGICVWERPEKHMKYINSLPIHKAMDEVRYWNRFAPGQVFVRIEDARLRKWIPRQTNEKWERGVREGAGSVKRDAKIWEDYLTDLGIPFELVPPKNNKTKVNADYFKKLTGYQERTNEHSRDAAMLVVGM
jgi:hypothetical protein